MAGKSWHYAVNGETKGPAVSYTHLTLPTTYTV